MVGCAITEKAAPASTPIQKTVVSQKPVVTKPVVNKPKPVQFEHSKEITVPALKKINDNFNTVSVTEYTLKQHKLHQISFKNAVLFQFDKAQITPINVAELKAFAQAYKNENVGSHLYIVGHTDSRGRQIYNQSLSVRRSLVIASLLANEGIPDDALMLVAAGELLPKVSNKTELGRAENRRVEILAADSKELVKAFLREIDCSDIDSACERATLPIMDLKLNNNQLVIRNVELDSVITLAPELNKLDELADDLAQYSAVDVDKRYSLSTDKRRLSSIKGLSQRKILSIPITKRTTSFFKPEVRSPLILSEKYYYKLETEL
nr:OmpA family protein [Pseudoalteromonas sp. MMG010]